MKIFGRKVGKAIKFPPVIHRLKSKLLSKVRIRPKRSINMSFSNIADEDIAFQLSLALPGFNKKDVQIELKDSILIIKGGKEQSHEMSNAHWLHQKFVSNIFYKSFNVPREADPDRVSAKISDGILQYKIVKKRIEIQKPIFKVA